MSQPLNLFFPQWQGATRIELYRGAELLRRAFPQSVSWTPVPVSSTYSLGVQQGILGYGQIETQLSNACRTLLSWDPERIFTLGGDCGVEIAPVSFLNRKYDEALNVVWLDAHGDLNTPATSPSQHFHGMPLRTLLGEGETTLVNRGFSTLKPTQVFLLGTRELDPHEAQFIRRTKMPILSPQAINQGHFEGLLSALERTSDRPLYIHLDLDVLDPNEFPHVSCPTPEGIYVEPLRDLLDCLSDRFDVVGFSLLELLPSQSDNIVCQDIAKILRAVRLPQWISA